MVSNRKLPLIFWNVFWRLQWFLDREPQSEGRKETIQRAEQFVAMLIEKDRDCMIISHGFFMHTLIRIMKKHAFKVDHISVTYSNGEYILAKR